MKFGTIHLFCPICGQPTVYNGSTAGYQPELAWGHSTWGYVCSKACFDAGELKYARMLLGKDD